MAKLYETGMVVSRSRILGGPGDHSVRGPEGIRRRLVENPWIEIDLGDPDELKRRYQPLGSNVCVANSKVGVDIIELADMAAQECKQLRMSLDPNDLSYTDRPASKRITRKGISWGYEGQVKLWIPFDDHEYEPDPTAEIKLSRRAIFSDLHIMPVRRAIDDYPEKTPSITIR